MSHDLHMCAGVPEEDESGFLTAACECGWKQDGLPDIETAIDWLMQHARESALIEDVK